jgi:uncharacterized membrane protein
MTDDMLTEQAEKENGSRIFARLRDYLFAGILVTAPIFITCYVTIAFLDWVDSKVTPLVPPEYNPNNYLPFSLPGLGLVIAIVFFILVGWFARNFLGRILFRIAEGVMHRVPVIRVMYKALKQVLETVMTNQSQAFREVVMVEYPRPGCWALGFVTGVTKGEVQALGAGVEMVNVFLPMTPPTGGFLLFLPRSALIPMKMTVEEGIKLLVSGGIITPEDGGRKKF